MNAFAMAVALSYHLCSVVLERRLQRFPKRHRLASNDVHQRPTLHSWENGLVHLVAKFLAGKDEARPRAA